MTQILVITYGDDTKEIDLNSVSNSELKPEDFQAFVDERTHHGEKLMTKNVVSLSPFHSQECKKHCEHMKELETKTPTEKDMMALLARRQLTVGVSATTHAVGRPQDQHGAAAGRPADQEGQAGDRAEASPGRPGARAQSRVRGAGQSARGAGEGTDGGESAAGGAGGGGGESRATAAGA